MRVQEGHTQASPSPHPLGSARSFVLHADGRPTGMVSVWRQLWSPGSVPRQVLGSLSSPSTLCTRVSKRIRSRSEVAMITHQFTRPVCGCIRPSVVAELRGAPLLAPTRIPQKWGWMSPSAPPVCPLLNSKLPSTACCNACMSGQGQPKGCVLAFAPGLTV